MIISPKAKWSGNLHVHKTAEELARAGAQLFIDESADAMRARGRFRVALSGGSTPRRVYSHYAAFVGRSQPC
jgi:6-phosphogluconolactonase